MLCFRKVPLAKTFRERRGGEGKSTKLSRHNFLSLSAENFRKKSF